MNNNECKNNVVSMWNDDVQRVSKEILCDDIYFSVCLDIRDIR